MVVLTNGNILYSIKVLCLTAHLVCAQRRLCAVSKPVQTLHGKDAKHADSDCSASSDRNGQVKCPRESSVLKCFLQWPEHLKALLSLDSDVQNTLA